MANKQCVDPYTRHYRGPIVIAVMINSSKCCDLMRLSAMAG